jgi:FkbM family methyltransferase
MPIKHYIRQLLNFLHLDLTKNLEYDRLTKKVMNGCIHQDSNCIDVGCHKGEMLDEILKISPTGTHFAFEPIPVFYNELRSKYGSRCIIYPYALAEENGTTTFNYVTNAPAYSGIKQRKYAVENPVIEKINVEIKKLDDVIPPTTKIDFIKIDVEGAELGVLKGAAILLKKDKPLLLFEFGLGASDYYNTTPADMYSFLVKTIGYKIYSLKNFLNSREALSEESFSACYDSNTEYYFVAAKN